VEPLRRGHVALIGMAGVGKSSVGRRLATLLGARYCDLDDAIVERSGLTVPEIFARSGEVGFRELETATLTTVLAEPLPTVIATGGGVVTVQDNVELLRSAATTVWLRAEPAVLLSRLRGSRIRRPLLEGDLESNVRELLAERKDLYEKAADIVVDTANDSVTAVAVRVAERIQQCAK
jgi:shikimate kinase